MKEREIITIRKGDFVKSMQIGDKPVNDIVIYGNREKLFQIQNGYFELRNINGITENVTSFKITEPVRANKVNLSRKDNFYVLDNEYYAKWKERRYILYIHESEIKVNKVTEIVSCKTDTKIYYIDIADLSFLHGCTTRNNSYTNIIVNRRFITRVELTEFGKKVGEVEKSLKEKNININTFDLEKIVKYYDLIEKK